MCVSLSLSLNLIWKNIISHAIDMERAELECTQHLSKKFEKYPN